MMFFLEGLSKLFLVILVAYVTTSSYTFSDDDQKPPTPSTDSAMGFLVFYFLTSALYEVGQYWKEHRSDSVIHDMMYDI
jgi:hypothetical protein